MSARAKKTAQQIVGLGTFQMAGPTLNARQGGFNASHLIPPPPTSPGPVPESMYLAENWVTDSGPAHWVAVTGWMSKHDTCAYLSWSQAGSSSPNIRLWRRVGDLPNKILGVDKSAGWLTFICGPAETVKPPPPYNPYFHKKTF